MEKIFSEPLFYIFFVYGVSFMIMTNLIIGGITRATSITLVSSFYMLAFFGLTHGTAELTDWARFIGRVLGRGENDFLLYTSSIFSIVSFVFLLQFAVNVLSYKWEKKGYIRSIPIVLLVVYLAVVFYLGISDVTKIALYARYGFGFLGAAMSAIMFYRLATAMKILDNQKLVRGLNISATSFAVYSVCGGLIVTPLFGLPIQLYRAACALVTAVATASILDVFKVE